MNTAITEDALPPLRRFRKRWILWSLLALWAGVGLWNTTKPMSPGTDVDGPAVSVDAADVQFLSDLTYTDSEGKLLHEQQIFDEVMGIVDQAETFVIADFFLFNEQMGAQTASYRRLSRELADHLIARKVARPNLAVLLISDPINEVYGGTHSPLFDQLRHAGIDVVLTDLTQLRDSNPAYSSLWRTFVQWWGNSAQGGSLDNPFDNGPSRISLRSWLALLNFKANHRKLIVADRADASLAALVTSANPHDASSAHSNVALRFTGAAALQLVESELAVARSSGWPGHIYAASPSVPAAAATNPVELKLVTEEAIRRHLLDTIDSTRNGDAVRIATFYLADRKIVGALLDAAQRNVSVRLILDPNRDAFGRQKDGVPNRPAANELVTRSDGKIQVRWYRTHGEQFHTKIALITRSGRLIASLGSANLTRRNIGNYNLEANMALQCDVNAPAAVAMLGYFERLWNNEGAAGTEFTEVSLDGRDGNEHVLSSVR
jgi:phosphatidylserine/phosphatidylglycerophosphate/cardiolipin synthase-like enzyme